MALPALAPVPPASLREGMVPREWELCLDSWIILSEKYLTLPAKTFVIEASKSPSISNFLVSYVKDAPVSKDMKSLRLRQQCFRLAHRTMTALRPIPSPLLEWDFLTNLCLVYGKSKALSKLLEDTWGHILDASPSLEVHKRTLIKMLETKGTESRLKVVLTPDLALFRACYRYGQFLMVGSDLIDALSSAYDRVGPNLRQEIVTVVYFSLTCLMGPEPKTSTLLDHLYSLKTTALVKALVESTPFLRKMRDGSSGQDSGRAKSLIEFLQTYETTPNGKSKRPRRRKLDKGKGRANDEYGHGALRNVHIHKLSLISQVQDLFPDLGSGFIIKLLDEYDDDSAQVTDHLLNDDLPAHLQGLDRTEEISHAAMSQTHDLAPDVAPHSTPPLLPTRRNIYDGDDFDRLAVDTSKLRMGKKEDITADQLLSSDRSTSQKTAILSALAAFDSDDDERDDTYDVEDVGGTVDMTNDENAADLRQEMHEEALFNAYKLTPDLFNRDAETRRGKSRAALRTETGMTDEALEGWAIMIGRDPRRLRRLEAKFEIGGGGQRALAGTAWKGDSGTEGTEDSDVGGAGRGGRGGRARGRGRGGGQWREGPGVAGAADEKGTQVARQRKDANKGSRANHNRRDQRAKKMARGGFSG
ncbi:hypothetical protein N7G274_002140 [Stereocaulon virgatum]|uniref:CUE domain-containing protein n=1 Tax=Stereocaulon virgatum TaxID=373712 RepID=A0ABR4ALZ8_9LECA